MATRTTITLEDGLHTKLKALAGARGMNQFINEVLWEKIQQLERGRTETLMKEGYLAMKSDERDLMRTGKPLMWRGWVTW